MDIWHNHGIGRHGRNSAFSLVPDPGHHADEEAFSRQPQAPGLISEGVKA